MGEHAVYASTSISLAAWETRAHLGKTGTQLPFNRFLVRIGLPGAVWAVRTSVPATLPVGWNSIPEGLVSRSLGSAWLNANSSALLVVPFVIIEEENNLIINPAHADTSRLRSVKVRRFLYDHRVSANGAVKTDST